MADSSHKAPRHGTVKQALDQYESALLRYAYSLVKDRQIAQEIVQETFMELWQVDSDFVSSGRLRGFLYTVCRNRAIDELRRRKAGPQAGGDPDLVADGAPDAHRVVVAREAHAGLAERMASLPEAQREVLRLKLQSDLTYREIADVTGHSVSNVGFMLHTAIQKLRAGLMPGGESSPQKGQKRRPERKDRAPETDGS